MKATFLNHPKPLLTNMVQADNPDDGIITVRNAVFDGCDAFGLQLCRLNPVFRTKEIYQSIFEFMEDKPIYITNYRQGYNEGVSDEALAEGLIAAIRAGATMADVMGDMFDPSPFEMTQNKSAIDRQKKLIEKIHSIGGEVLISSHISNFLPAEKVLEIATQQQKRGADIVKIVTAANSQEEELENLRITTLLKKELRVPFLFLSTGSHYKLHRMIGPMLGSVMYLCVQRHDALSTKSQPVLRSVREVLGNFDYKPNRKFGE